MITKNQDNEDNSRVFDALDLAKEQYETYLELSRIHDLTQLVSKQSAYVDVSYPRPLTIVLNTGTTNQYASLERITK